jgi:methylated-DNA-[protein]-cysteine S-methyltransferase
MKTDKTPASGAMRDIAREFDAPAIDELVRRAHRRMRSAISLIRRPAARVGIVTSPVGRLLVAEGPRGLAAIHFLEISSGERTLDALRRRFDLGENAQWQRDIDRELRRYFEGDFSVLGHRVDLCLVSSDFQRRALERLRRVPTGSVITYRGLAAAVGEPDSQRAIGNTMASNPVPIFVPCHRVIRSDGTIGNYGGGVQRKLLLLRTEGFHVGRDLRLAPETVLGHRHTRIFCRPQCSAAQRADATRMLMFADAQHARTAGMRACRLCRPE